MISTTYIPLIPRAAVLAHAWAGPGTGLGNAVAPAEGRAVGGRVARTTVRVLVGRRGVMVVVGALVGVMPWLIVAAVGTGDGVTVGTSTTVAVGGAAAGSAQAT